MDRIIKVLILGDTDTGKTTLANHLINSPFFVSQEFDYVPIDKFVNNTMSLFQAIHKKKLFVSYAAKRSNSIIECSGLGFTGHILNENLEILKSAFKNTYIFCFVTPNNNSYIKKKDRENPLNVIHYFRNYTPIMLHQNSLEDRTAAIINIIKNKIPELT